MQRPGKKVLLYCGAYTYRDFLQHWTDFSDVDLMIARYPWLPVVVDKDLPNLLGVRTAWTIWQYSEKWKGADYGVGSTNVDLDVFNGNVMDMRSYFMVDQQPVPDPEPAPDSVDPSECAECRELKKRASAVVLASVELSKLL